MKRLLLLTSVLLSMIILSSCVRKDNQIDINKALSIITAKFSQLPKGNSDVYRLVRSVTIGDKDIELQLRSTPDSSGEPQKVIIVINKAKQVYTIPLFSNIYYDYWGFKFEEVYRSVKPTHATFEQELKNCFTQLNLYDTLGTAGQVINEMLVSLLQCRRMTDRDSFPTYASALTCSGKEEILDSCDKRAAQNSREIKMALTPQEGVVEHIVYWDEENSRVYQLYSKKLYRFKDKPQFTLKNYRMDCFIQSFNL